ncbi:MAG: class I SAM-dependent methyltransferase, partial [Thermotogota bacterium]
LKDLRKEFVPKLQGKTLDIAVGTGHNIQYYPSGSNVVLLDKSQKMLKLAKEKAKATHKELKLEFQHAPAESLPFENNTFDTILSIDVFCSIKKPKKVLQELHRVLKKDGKAIFVEHMKTGKYIQDFFLSIITIFTYLAVGSSMIRPIDKYIQSSDFKIENVEDLKGSFKSFICIY